ncbi:MAG: DUF4293 domain-containing protein [Flavobacteriaceae bacterium]|nr:DUF4293 domain-containing protein [Flavobacteriaceae bacterium]
MIQRIQTVYLVLAAIVSGGLIFAFSLWTQADRNVYVLDLFAGSDLKLKLVPVLFIVSAVMALISIFLFTNRKLQFVLNRITILINLFLLGLLLYYLLMLPGEMEISEKGIGVFLPIVNVLLLVLANKAIQKDENLVKSVDRLR